MIMSEYSMIELNKRLKRMLSPTTPTLGLKYIKDVKELDSITNLNMVATRAGICVLIGYSIAFNQTFGVRKEVISKLCGGACGVCDNRDDFFTGARISTDFKWHANLEVAHEHMISTADDLPHG